MEASNRALITKREVRSGTGGLIALWLATHCQSRSPEQPGGVGGMSRSTLQIGSIPYRRFFKRLFIIANSGWRVQVLPRIRPSLKEAFGGNQNVDGSYGLSGIEDDFVVASRNAANFFK